MLFLSLFLACTSPSLNVESVDSGVAQTKECATLKDHVICDFPAVNRLGETPNLSDLYGSPIVLDLSAMWCGPCKAAASNLQDAADSLPDVTFLTVLIENTAGQPPEPSDLASWSSDYSITSEPVWGSSREIISSDPTEMKDHLYLAGWPTFYFIDSKGNLKEYVRGYDESAILAIAAELD